MDTRPTRLAPAAAGMLTALTLALTLALVMTPAPVAAQSACGGFYTVQTGDNLAEVAERCGVTVPALLAVNPGVADERDLEVGNRLRVPDPRARQPSPVQACGPSYTVRTGDTLREIAMKCGLTVPLLVAANGPIPQPLGVNAGMRLRIPDVPRAAVDDPATLAAARAAGTSTIILGDTTNAAAAAAVTADSAAAAAAAAEPAGELGRVEGTLEAGAPCLTVRDANGDAVAIAGEINDAFRPGDPVVLLGTPATDHECGSARTLELRILYRGGA